MVKWFDDVSGPYLSFTATVPSPTMVELSSSAYAVHESSGAVCVNIVANRTVAKPFCVYVIPVMKQPTSATCKTS